MIKKFSTSILYGDDAKKVIEEIKAVQSERSKRNGKKLLNYFKKLKGECK